MNIFHLYLDPRDNAAGYSNEHLKIILEITQCGFTVLHTRMPDMEWQTEFPKVYKPTHRRHPVVVWMSQTMANFQYAIVTGLALCVENRKRRGKPHACEPLLRLMMSQTIPEDKPPVSTYAETTVLAARSNPEGVTPVPLCMDEQYMVRVDGVPDLIASYQNYYVRTKMVFQSGRLATFATVPAFARRAYSEAVAMKALLALSHPHICSVLHTKNKKQLDPSRS